MADYVKVKIAEKNGAELEWEEEYELIPVNIPFDDPGFTALDVKTAIIEAKSVGETGPEGPQGPPGLDARRYETDVSNAISVSVDHNFGVIPVETVVSLVVSYEDNKYNVNKYNTRKFGTGIVISGTPERIDPGTYTRVDSLDFNSCTFTFAGPITGKIILLG